MSNFPEVKNVLRTIWDGIAPDVMAMCGGVMARDEVIEVVLDADRPAYFWTEPDRTELEAFRALSCDAQNAVAAEVFTYDEYCN